jgi:hypothetical protein
MDTGGKVATGVLVPLGVIGLAVGGYLLLRGSKNRSDYDIINFGDSGFVTKAKGGGKRRTHRRRH